MDDGCLSSAQLFLSVMWAPQIEEVRQAITASFTLCTAFRVFVEVVCLLILELATSKHISAKIGYVSQSRLSITKLWSQNISEVCRVFTALIRACLQLKGSLLAL
jgi:hypothetical protein